MNEIPRKILVAVDGSDPSFHAIEYLAYMIPPGDTDVVLFHVDVDFPPVWEDFQNNPLYRSRIHAIHQWVSYQHQVIDKFMDRAVHFLTNAGFHKSRIRIKIQRKRIGVTTDIAKESRENYDMVVVGRTGLSRLKDILMGSVAMKLMERIRHIPLVVVGGSPFTRRLMVAFDGSDGAMKGVMCVAGLLGRGDCEVKMCHVESPPVQGTALKPAFAEAKGYLLEAGLPPERVTWESRRAEPNPAKGIISDAVSGGFGSIVVGRRGAVSFFEELFHGRVSRRVVDMADRMSVWVVN